MKNFKSIGFITLLFAWVVMTVPLPAYAGNELQEQPSIVQSSVPDATVSTDPASPTVEAANPITIIDDLKGVKDWQDLLNKETAIYTILITLGGYLSYLIPGLKTIDNNTYRVLTWAVLVIAGAAVLGMGNIWQGALAYLFSTSLYEVILKWLVKSKKPSTA